MVSQLLSMSLMAQTISFQSLMTQTISFQCQSNDTWIQPAHLHCLPFTKINIHRSVAHSTCGILSRALPVLLSASEHTCSWGLSQALSSMCALCLLTQEELRGTNPAFTAHTVWASILLTAVMETGDGKFRSSQRPDIVTCTSYLNLWLLVSF